MGVPSVVKAEEGSAKVALEGCGDRTGPTTIHIHINQESCLTSLWKAVQHIRRPSPPAHKEAGSTETPLTPKDGPRARAGSDGEQKVLGGAQILLGVFCVVLGIEILRGYRRMVSAFGFIYYRIVLDGTAFWMGSAFIIAGIFSVVGARCGGFWVHVATFFNLASVVTGSVGFMQTLNEVRHFDYWYISDYICQSLERKSYGWPEVTPSYIPDRSWLERCKAFVESFMMFSVEMRIILLVLAGVAVVISLFGLGYGLRLLCRRFWAKVDVCDYNALVEQEAPPVYNNEEDPERRGDAA